MDHRCFGFWDSWGGRVVNYLEPQPTAQIADGFFTLQVLWFTSDPFNAVALDYWKLASPQACPKILEPLRTRRFRRVEQETNINPIVCRGILYTRIPIVSILNSYQQTIQDIATVDHDTNKEVTLNRRKIFRFGLCLWKDPICKIWNKMQHRLGTCVEWLVTPGFL